MRLLLLKFLVIIVLMTAAANIIMPRSFFFDQNYMFGLVSFAAFFIAVAAIFANDRLGKIKIAFGYIDWFLLADFIYSFAGMTRTRFDGRTEDTV